MPKARSVLISIGLILLVGSACLFLSRPVRNWRSDLALTIAQEASNHNQPEKAALAAQRALQLNSHNRPAQEILAELAGKISPAEELQRRRQILDQNPADQEAILDFCLAAVRAGDLEAGTKILGSWPGSTHDLRFCRAAAALALGRKQEHSAFNFLQEAALLPNAEPADHLRFAALEASSTDPSRRAEGLAALEHLKSSEEVGAEAQQALISSAMARGDLLSARKYLQDWLPGGLTKASLFLGLEVYLRLDQGKLNELVNQGFAVFKGDGRTCGQLIDWLNQHGNSDLALQSSKGLEPEARKVPFFKFAYADALDRVGHWQELLDRTAADNWGHVDCLRLALRTRAAQKLSRAQPLEFTKTWNKCIDLAGQNQQALWVLIEFAQRWSLDSQTETALWAIAACPQGQIKAIEKLEGIYQENRDTLGLFNVAKRLLELNPDDRRAQSRFVLLGLLLYSSIDTRRDSFYEFANKCWEKNRTPEMAAAYAYCLLLKGKSKEALVVFEDLKDNAGEPQALYKGLIDAANGQPEAALSYFQIASSRSDLLPQEQALLERAMLSSQEKAR